MAFYDNFNGKEKLIAAHRGFRANRPENTMSAFEASLGKCDFIELDVAFSKDGVAVIIHDDSCKRTSDVAEFIDYQYRFNVCDLEYEELLKLDFGTWFINEDPYNTIKKRHVNKKDIESQNIPTLKEVLQFCKQNSMPVNVEIKDLSKTKFHKSAVANTIDIILEEQMQDLVLLSSFNHKYLKEAKKIAPFIQRAALQEKSHPAELSKYLKKLDVVAYNCEDEIVNEEVLSLLKEGNIFVNVYTVNSKKRKTELFNLGINSIFTDCL